MWLIDSLNEAQTLKKKKITKQDLADFTWNRKNPILFLKFDNVLIVCYLKF